MFFPLVLLGLWRRLTESGNRFQDWWAPASLLGVAAAGLVLSHQLSAALAAVVCVLLVAFNPRALGTPRFWLGIGIAAVLAVSLSAVFVLPLWEVWRTGLYNVFDPHSFFSVNYPDHAANRTIPITNLLFELPTSVGGHVRAGVGLVVLAGVITALLLNRRLGRARRLVVQFTVIGLAAAVMASSLTPWQALPRVIWTIQFPFRLMLIVAVTWSAVAGIGFAAAARTIARGNRRRPHRPPAVVGPPVDHLWDGSRHPPGRNLRDGSASLRPESGHLGGSGTGRPRFGDLCRGNDPLAEASSPCQGQAAERQR